MKLIIQAVVYGGRFIYEILTKYKLLALSRFSGTSHLESIASVPFLSTTSAEAAHRWNNGRCSYGNFFCHLHYYCAG